VTSANFDPPTKKSRTKRLGVGKPCERDKDDIPLNRPDDAPTAGAYAPDAAVTIDNGGDRKRGRGLSAPSPHALLEPSGEHIHG
jgi:hypothetical protein